MLPHSLQNDVPAFDRVALLTVRTHLTAMDVSMTVRAIGSSVGEDGLGMALRTGHTFVQTAEGVSRFVVIKLRDRADRFPACRSMAVLAGYVQVAMGTAGDRGAGLTIERTCAAADDQIQGSQENDRRRQ